jgi:hypothetical protein
MPYTKKGRRDRAYGSASRRRHLLRHGQQHCDWGIAVANNTEVVAGAVSDRIINDLTFLARQPINLPVFMLREKDTAVILYGGLDGLEVLVSEGREGQRRRTCS